MSKRKSIKEYDILEEITRSATCPYCLERTDMFEYNDTDDVSTCEECGEDFDIERE